MSFPGSQSQGGLPVSQINFVHREWRPSSSSRSSPPKKNRLLKYTNSSNALNSSPNHTSMMHSKSTDATLRALPSLSSSNPRINSSVQQSNLLQPLATRRMRSESFPNTTMNGISSSSDSRMRSESYPNTSTTMNGISCDPVMTMTHETIFIQTDFMTGQSPGEQTSEGESKEQNVSSRIPSTINTSIDTTSIEHKDSNTSDESVNLCLQLPQFVNTIMKRKRKRLKHQKDLYTEAAKQIQLEKENYMNGQEDVSKQKIEAKRKGMRRLLDIAAGDVGLALFIPINWEAFEPLAEERGEYCSVNSASNSSGTRGGDNESSDESSDSEASSEEEDELIIASDDEIENCPSILSEEQMKFIQKKGLPPTLSLMTWNRMYSLQRDGDCFHTMFKKVSRHQHSMIIIKTADGDILGGYADTPWANQRSGVSRGSFFGGGRGFLFATNPLLSEEDERAQRDQIGDGDAPFSFFRWTGANEYSQICDFDAGTLGMGGGGSFGFFVQDNFTRGSSGACETFSNPPLVKSSGGSFDVVDVEVYVFTSMSTRLFNASSRTSSFASVNSTLSSSMHSTKSISSMLSRQSLV